MDPQSLSQALDSLSLGPLCSGPASLLAIHHAESPRVSLRALSQQHWQPTTPPWLRLASLEVLCLLPGEARVCLFTVPYSEDWSPWLLCGDSVSAKQLGGSASGREVSQEIIHHKRT